VAHADREDWPVGCQVEVKVLKDVPQATQVMVEPASPDDWEIVVRMIDQMLQRASKDERARTMGHDC
jgi:hypothetical protein